MEIPEIMFSIGFWVKFAFLFGLCVIIPIFFLDFTGSMIWWRKILFMVGGTIGIILALNGKSLRKRKPK